MTCTTSFTQVNGRANRRIEWMNSNDVSLHPKQSRASYSRCLSIERQHLSSFVLGGGLHFQIHLLESSYNPCLFHMLSCGKDKLNAKINSNQRLSLINAFRISNVSKTRQSITILRKALFRDFLIILGICMWKFGRFGTR